MEKRYIYALGFFDGVHLGHQALLEACAALAEANGLEPGAVTFGTHPEALTQGGAPVLINTPADRERLLSRFVRRVITLPFDEHIRTMAWEDFLELLAGSYGAAGFVCGDDFRFGHKGAGNGSLLENWCRQRGLPFAQVPEQTLEGIRVSSTHIRALLEEGRLEEADRFLGHPHILTGTVVPGKQLGRRLGIPTANLRLPEGTARMKHGVYACRCRLEGRDYAAVTNIGLRPTVSGRGVTVEPWILGWEGDLYGREITLEFLAFLRPEERFDSLEALKEAIHRDAERAARIAES
ncbi:MAG: riboflavin biosynthesis protein RibF [Clostridia bacterium]|nr:riboflavin biosynthesis protein RibF [Clostridia bacterium]